jgi:MscS family membrane protein
MKDESGDNIPPDYGTFVKWVHETNMEILKRFDSEGLEFAFPTSTTYLARDAKREPRFLVSDGKK